jgi:hypothetical protein
LKYVFAIALMGLIYFSAVAYRSIATGHILSPFSPERGPVSAHR